MKIFSNFNFEIFSILNFCSSCVYFFNLINSAFNSSAEGLYDKAEIVDQNEIQVVQSYKATTYNDRAGSAFVAPKSTINF